MTEELYIQFSSVSSPWINDIHTSLPPTPKNAKFAWVQIQIGRMQKLQDVCVRQQLDEDWGHQQMDEDSEIRGRAAAHKFVWQLNIGCGGGLIPKYRWRSYYYFSTCEEFPESHMGIWSIWPLRKEIRKYPIFVRSRSTLSRQKYIEHLLWGGLTETRDFVMNKIQMAIQMVVNSEIREK